MKRQGWLSSATWVFLCVLGGGAWAEGTGAPDQYESETAAAPAVIGELKLEGDIAAPGVERTVDASFSGDSDQNDWYGITLRDERISPSCFGYSLRFEVQMTPLPGVQVEVMQPGTLATLSQTMDSPFRAIANLSSNSCGSANAYLINVHREPGSPVPVQYALNLRLNRDIYTPMIAEISPTRGPVGTTVTITGQDLVPYVKFNGASAAVMNYTSNSMTAAVPSGARTGPISVYTAVSQQIFTVTGGTSPTTKKGESTVKTLCCTVLTNSNLKGLGRVVVAFPSGALPKATRVAVLKDGKEVKAGFGSRSWDLLPGTYEVKIGGKTLSNVTVQAGHDTNVKVGVLRVAAGNQTKVEVLEGGKIVASGHGNAILGLPPGSYDMKIAGQTQTITINEGQITEF